MKKTELRIAVHIFRVKTMGSEAGYPHEPMLQYSRFPIFAFFSITFAGSLSFWCIGISGKTNVQLGRAQFQHVQCCGFSIGSR